MKIPSNILHDKQYADKILEITADTMFFVYKDGTCLDFKANTTDFFIKEQDIIGRNIFSYFPVETAREMYAEFIKVRAGDKPSARNYKLILEDDVKYYKCIISKYDEEHFLFQYRDITGRSVVRLKLEKKQKDLCEVEKAVASPRASRRPLGVQTRLRPPYLLGSVPSYAEQDTGVSAAW